METDEVDSMLVQQLSTMGTNDKELLVRQFRQVLGVELPDTMCTFFMDMTNWNLQDAIGAYYDHGERMTMNDMSQIQHGYLNLQFVRDVTIGEGESVPPLTRFVKTWRVRNSGSMHWPEGCRLCFMEGASLTETTQSEVVCVPPGEEADLSVEMASPLQPGIYQSRWQLNTMQQIAFGESIWCIVQVDANGILDITQQMARIEPSEKMESSVGSSSSHFPSMVAINPFQREVSTHMAEAPMDPVIEDRFHPSPPVLSVLPMIRSGAIPIQQNEGTEGPHCTPCTPPNERME